MTSSTGASPPKWFESWIKKKNRKYLAAKDLEKINDKEPKDREEKGRAGFEPAADDVTRSA